MIRLLLFGLVVVGALTVRAAIKAYAQAAAVGPEVHDPHEVGAA